MIDVAAFERERPWLVGVAYRLLGSAADAEDVVQEAFLRVAAVDDVQTPRAYLTTVVTRLCLDEVRSARRRREGYVGEWLPEPVATEAPAGDERAAEAESVSMAFLTMLEALSPLERAVFVLHEVFDLTMPEVSVAVGRSDAACRQLLHRARENLSARRTRRRRLAPADAESAVVALMTALSCGDLAGLQALLVEDVRAVSDHGGKASAARRPVAGVDAVARFVLGLTVKHARGGGAALLAWINGAVSVVALEGERVTAVMVPDLVDDAGGARVAGFYLVRNPDKLARVDAARRDGTLRAFTPGAPRSA